MEQAGVARVVVIGFQPLLGRGVRAVLEDQPGWRVVAELAEGEDGVEQARVVDPHLVILDLPWVRALRCLERLRTRLPHASVLALTAAQGARSARSGGGLVLLSRSASLEEFLRALRRAQDRPPGPSGRAGPGAALASPPELSAREVEVLQLLAKGETAEAIARQLTLSGNTVKTHLKRIYRKLNAKGRAQAVLKGFCLGVLADLDEGDPGGSGGAGEEA